jgi:hypothetical protein
MELGSVQRNREQGNAVGYPIRLGREPITLNSQPYKPELKQQKTGSLTDTTNPSFIYGFLRSGEGRFSTAETVSFRSARETKHE